MDFARNLRGFCVGFARNLILFLLEREHEGYKRFADCTVPCALNFSYSFMPIISKLYRRFCYGLKTCMHVVWISSFDYFTTFSAS